MSIALLTRRDNAVEGGLLAMKRATKLRLLVSAARVKVAREYLLRLMDAPPRDMETLYNELGAAEGVLRDVQNTLERLSRD